MLFSFAFFQHRFKIESAFGECVGKRREVVFQLHDCRLCGLQRVRLDAADTKPLCSGVLVASVIEARRAGRQFHVRQRFHDAGLFVNRSHFVRIGNGFVDGDALAGIDAPGHGRRDVGGGEVDDVVVMAAGLARERPPALHGFVPGRAFRRVRPPLEIGEGRLVRVHIACARAAFDGHVAHGHAFFHREAVEHIAAVFVGEARAAVHAQRADDVENDVLRINARTQVAVDVDPANLQLAQRHGLRREHIAHLACADAERDRAERAVRARVRIAAGDGRARLRDALLGADHVHDALLARRAIEKRDPKLRAILAQFIHHGLRERIAIRFDHLVGRDNVVHRRERALRKRHLQAEIAQHAEGLRARDLVDQMRADDQLGLAVGQFAHRVGVPDFLEERFGHEKGPQGSRLLPCREILI